MSIKSKISILGMGYVGLPLAYQASKKFNVIGFDINEKKINNLRKNIDPTQTLKKNNKFSKKITFSNKSEIMKGSDFFVICVPTPVKKNNKPDLNNLITACKLVGRNIKKKSTVIIESTVYPGCTEELCIPILENTSGLVINKDFYCGFSPERINPGDKIKTINNITKVISGSNLKALSLIYRFYSSFIKAKVYKSKSIKIAESAKIIENTQRDINIALINEFYKICERQKINIYDVIDTAKTKWNFSPYYPGLVGGHCIGIDPYYLTFAAEKLGVNPRMILSGRYTNDNFYKYLLSKIKKNIQNKRNLKTLIIGFAFKENCNDVRNTKIYDLYLGLKKISSCIDVYDPIADKFESKKYYKVNLASNIPNKNYDLTVICLKHNFFMKTKIKNKIKKVSNKGYIYDFKNLLEN